MTTQVRDVMKYNICLVRPSGYIHSDAFLELAQLLAYTLEDLGHETTIKYHSVDSTGRNIILGCHLLNLGSRKSIPKSSIIINTEQMFSGDSEYSSRWSNTVLEWAKNYETWDYSEKNIETFARLGVAGVKHLKIGFHPKLTRIPKQENQDIDVLFYGFVNARRLKILEDLKNSGCKVEVVTGVYGHKRDELISRAKIVLNMHYYQTQIFEIIRVFYLMSNSKAVVSEVNPETSVSSNFLKGILPAPYNAIVDRCHDLLNDENSRNWVEANALKVISELPQGNFLRDLL